MAFPGRPAVRRPPRGAAPLGAHSLRGWCARNPAVVKGGGSGADRGPGGWVLPVIGQRLCAEAEASVTLSSMACWTSGPASHSQRHKHPHRRRRHDDDRCPAQPPKEWRVEALPHEGVIAGEKDYQNDKRRSEQTVEDG